MIHFLNQPQSLPRPEALKASDPFSEASLKSRRDFSGLLYAGRSHSLAQLPHLGLTWRALETLFQDSGKPIGDLGACFSTLALEGNLRGVEVVPVDITLKEREKSYAQRVVSGLQELLPYYLGIKAFPVGFEPSRSVSSSKLLERALLQAAERELKRAVICDLGSNQIPNRHFSLTVVHEAVPKHSASSEDFISRQLPEILRVTDREARIYPLTRYFERRSGGSLSLEPVEDLTLQPHLLEKVAARCGFNFEFSTPYDFFLIDEKLSLHCGCKPEVGIFTRACRGS